MTEYERIREQFNATAECIHHQRPRLDYEPGCLFVECNLESCKCRAIDGDGGPVSPFLINWQQRFGR